MIFLVRLNVFCGRSFNLIYLNFQGNQRKRKTSPSTTPPDDSDSDREPAVKKRPSQKPQPARQDSKSCGESTKLFQFIRLLRGQSKILTFNESVQTAMDNWTLFKQSNIIWHNVRYNLVYNFVYKFDDFMTLILQVSSQMRRNRRQQSVPQGTTCHQYIERYYIHVKLITATVFPVLALLYLVG